MKGKTVKILITLAIAVNLISTGLTVNAQPKVMEDGTIFDAEYYAERYADVVAVYGTDEAALFQHYVNYGKAENREAVKLPGTDTFDPAYYAKQNPDVVAVYGNGSNSLYQHYLQYGKEEGRQPTANSGASAVTSAQTSNEKAQPQNSPLNEKVLRRGADVTGWSVIQSQSEYFEFPVEDCFETASGVYVVCKGWVCQFFDSASNGSYGQHALWELGNYGNGSPYDGYGRAKEGVNFWKIN